MLDLSLYPRYAMVQLCLGSFVVAHHIYTKWLQSWNFNFFAVNAFVKGAIVVLGFLMLSQPSLVKGSLWFNAFYSIATLFAAFLVVRLDKSILSWAFRFKKQGYSDENRVISHQRILSFGTPKTQLNKQVRLRNRLNAAGYENKKTQFGLVSILLLAVFEEILFRGFLFELSLAQEKILFVILSLLGVSVVFCLSHIVWGWVHVLAKVPLTIFTGGAVLLFGSIVPAIVLHAAFNFLVYSRGRHIFTSPEGRGRARSARVRGIKF